MSYLPEKIPNARVLLVVKAYPAPSSKYGDLVCTAGIIETEGRIRWVRIYPVHYSLFDDRKFPKYSWVEVNLVRNEKDFRPESYRPERGIDEPFRFIRRLGTEGMWEERRRLLLQEVYTSMDALITDAKTPSFPKSLAVFRPARILNFTWEPEKNRQWTAKEQQAFRQLGLFDEQDKPRIRKLPYRYFYVFEGEEGKRHKLMIEDWEIGALFWNCLKKTDGKEEEANQLVRQKYLDEFTAKCDLYFFVGTTKRFHWQAPNPFVIIGVFYPPKERQLSLF